MKTIGFKDIISTVFVFASKSKSNLNGQLFCYFVVSFIVVKKVNTHRQLMPAKFRTKELQS